MTQIVEVVRLHHVLQPVRPDVAVVAAGEDEVELVINTHRLPLGHLLGGDLEIPGGPVDELQAGA